MTLGEYAQEFVDYLCKKLPDINQATAMEIAEFATMKANNYAYDMVKENNDRWFKSTERSNELYSKFMKGKSEYGSNHT
jgi:hypothetical protein